MLAVMAVRQEQLSHSGPGPKAFTVKVLRANLLVYIFNLTFRQMRASYLGKFLHYGKFTANNLWLVLTRSLVLSDPTVSTSLTVLLLALRKGDNPLMRD